MAGSMKKAPKKIMKAPKDIKKPMPKAAGYSKSPKKK